MSLTAKDVAEIVRLLDQSSFDELNLEVGDLKLRLKRGVNGAVYEAPGSERDPDFEPNPESVRPERSRRASLQTRCRSPLNPKRLPAQP